MAAIDDYRFGRIVIDGQEHTKDVIVLPTRIYPEWWRRDGHSLATEDLDDVIDELPAHVVVGAGAQGRLVPEQSAVADLQARGHTVEVLPTGEAVKRYRELDPGVTAAALHLTC